MSKLATSIIFVKRSASLIRYRDGDGGRALVQRTLRDHVRAITVMIRLHWELSNTFEHYGPGDFGMLGWDAFIRTDTPSVFQFGEPEAQQIHEQLLDSMPRELFGLACEGPISVSAMRHMIANRTAARFADLDRVILQLAREKELEIRTSDNKVRSRSLKRLAPSDLIALPETLLFPALSRVGSP